MPAHKWQKTLHRLFQIGIVLKGLDGLSETVGGMLFLFISGQALRRFTFLLTRPELLEDPDDLIANSLRHAFAHLSNGRKLFVGAYLLGHGIIKLLLVIGLLRDKLWVFPVAIVTLLGFIGYQVFRITSHFSLGLAALTVLDALIVALVWHEWRSQKTQRAAA
jgi:uncharacterized membrane protein